MAKMAFRYDPAVLLRIHDGDTVAADIQLAVAPTSPVDVDLGFNLHLRPDGLWVVNQSVRLFGCDAPELKTRAGKKSLAFLLTLVKVGDRLALVSQGWDKYGARIDGSFTLADGRDLVATLIAAGHAKPWSGKGPKPKHTTPRRTVP